MELIRNSIKRFYHFLKDQKYKWLVFFLLTAGFFLIRFPYEEAVLYMMNKTAAFTQLKYEDFYIHPVGPTLVFKQPEMLMKAKQRVVTANQLSIRPSYAALIRFKLGAVINVRWLDSVLSIQLRQARVKKAKSQGWLMRVQASGFNPAALSSILPVLSKTKGRINLRSEILVDPNFEIQPQGFWLLEAKSIQSQILSYTFPGTIGTISLPEFKWGQISSQGQIKEGEITLIDLSIGKGKDSFQIKSRGFVSMDLKKLGPTIRPRLKNYNIGLDILASAELKPKLYFLDLFLSSAEKKTATGWRYLAQIKGNSANLFNLSPVSELPSLKQMQETTNNPFE